MGRLTLPGILNKLYDVTCVCGHHGLLLAARDLAAAARELRSHGWSKTKAGWSHPAHRQSPHVGEERGGRDG